MKYSISFLTSILLLGCSSNKSPENPIKDDETFAFVRNAHSMAYHQNDSAVYLFGGASEKEVLADLWVLDDNNWHEVASADGPEPRTFAPLTYDPTNDRLLLFGGSKVLFGKESSVKNLLNDTWEYKNNAWRKIETSNAPIPRAEAAMAFDENRGVLLLFGGYTIEDGSYIKLGDTWEFRNEDWNLVSEEGPTPRHGVSMSYFPEEESIILFGGSTADKQYGPTAGETWKWNGEAWDKMQITQPSGVFNAVVAYDRESMNLVRFGGWTGGGRTNETWTFQDSSWNKLELATSPSERNHSSMVYDQKNKRMLLFGGHDGANVFGDTWEFTNGTWRVLIEVSPTERVKNGH